MPQYVELHAQSAFSFLEGASSPEQLAPACANLEMPAMAMRMVSTGQPAFTTLLEIGHQIDRSMNRSTAWWLVGPAARSTDCDTNGLRHNL